MFILRYHTQLSVNFNFKILHVPVHAYDDKYNTNNRFSLFVHEYLAYFRD